MTTNIPVTLKARGIRLSVFLLRVIELVCVVLRVKAPQWLVSLALKPIRIYSKIGNGEWRRVPVELKATLELIKS